MSDAIATLWADAREHALAAGDVLFRAGDPVRVLYRVEIGTVRLARALPQGAELVVQRAGAGDILAEASLFAAAYHCDAVAAGPARVRGVPVEQVARVLEHDADAARALARHLALEIQRARARAEIAALKTVRERVDAWLALNGGELPPRGRWREVAAETGTTPEALYRELASRRRAEPAS